MSRIVELLVPSECCRDGEGGTSPYPQELRDYGIKFIEIATITSSGS